MDVIGRWRKRGERMLVILEEVEEEGVEEKKEEKEEEEEEEEDMKTKEGGWPWLLQSTNGRVGYLGQMSGIKETVR